MFIDSSVNVQCLGEQQHGDEKRVFYRVLNQDGEPTIANGVVCGKRW